MVLIEIGPNLANVLIQALFAICVCAVICTFIRGFFGDRN